MSAKNEQDNEEIYEVGRLLIDNGANPYQKDYHGEMPIRSWGRLEVSKKLYDYYDEHYKPAEDTIHHNPMRKRELD